MYHSTCLHMTGHVMKLYRLHIYIYIYKHTTMSGSQKPLFSCRSSFPSHCAGLTQRGGSYVGFIRRVLPGVDPWRYPVAKCACSAGPDPGSPSSPITGWYPISGKECAQRGSRSRVFVKYGNNRRLASWTWKPAQSFAFEKQNGGKLWGAGRRRVPSLWRQDTQMCVVTHNRQPWEPNEGSGLGGWVHRLVTRGSGMPIPFTWTNQWLQV